MSVTVARTPAAVRDRAMGSAVEVVVIGGDEALAGRGLARVRELERRWSRFLPDSDVSRLNRAEGRPVHVSPATTTLVQRAIAGWALTDGAFDPSVGPSLIAHGYDRDFELVRGRIAAAPRASAAPGLGGVRVDGRSSTVTLPAGVFFDPGGIGKGLAADLAVDALLAAGAAGALVNVGGDLRVGGEPPDGDGWTITIPDPLAPHRELLRLAIPSGAVATSGRLERRWSTVTGPAHHLIDPASGRPARTDVAAVTVVAGEAWWAEVLTKALFLSGPAALGRLAHAHAVVVMDDGTRHATAELEATLR